MIIFASLQGYPVLSPSVDSTSPVDDDDDDDIDSSIKSSPGMTSSMTSSITSSPRSLTSDSSTSGSQLDSLSAWYCSSTPQPAVVGINRVWVCQQHRRMGVATRILDTIRSVDMSVCLKEPYLQILLHGYTDVYGFCLCLLWL